MLDLTTGNPIKKRFRIPVSCRVCRKRKTKCDRTKPKCQYCLKNHVECVYEDPSSWEEQSQVTQSESDLGSYNSDHRAEYTERLERELLALRRKISSIESKLEEGSSSAADEQLDVLPLGHPYVDPGDTISFYAMYNSATGKPGALQSLTAFSWLTTMKKDPFVRVVWLCIISTKERRALDKALKESRYIYLPDPDGSPLTDTMKMDRHKPSLLAAERNGDTKSKNIAEDKAMESPMVPTCDNGQAGDTAMIAHSKFGLPRFSTYEELQQMALQKLINRRVIWLLIDRFFKYVYPMFPYLNENMFIKNTTRLIGERSMVEDKVEHIKIENKQDIAFAGILLYVLEFGSLSLLNNSGKYDSEDTTVAYLINNPIPQDNGETANHCFHQFKFLKHVSLEILQLAIYKRLFARYAPMEGDSIDKRGLHIFDGLLLQMAVSLGLNRDSDACGNAQLNTHDFNDNAMVPEHIANLKRRIWHFIVLNDSYQTCFLEGSTSARIDFYDTALPHPPTEANKNSGDKDIETFIYESFQQQAKYDALVKTFIYDILSFEPSRVRSILSRVSKVEKEVETEFTDIQTILFKKYRSGNQFLDNLRKISAINQYFQIKCVLQLVYYQIYVHYEMQGGNNDVAFYYLQQTFRSAIFMSDLLVHFLSKSSLYFGVGFDYYLTPTLELVFHRSTHLKYGLQIRLKHYRALTAHETDSTHLIVVEKLNRTLDALLKSHYRIVKALITITDKYYYAWKICKIQRLAIIFLSRKETDFYVGPDNIARLTGDAKGIAKIPQYSVFQKVDPQRFISFLGFVEDALRAKKVDRIFDPDIVDSADSLIFSYGYDIGHYSKASSASTSKKSSPNDSFYHAGESPTNERWDSDISTDPQIDKWWFNFQWSTADTLEEPHPFGAGYNVNYPFRAENSRIDSQSVLNQEGTGGAVQEDTWNPLQTGNQIEQTDWLNYDSLNSIGDMDIDDIARYIIEGTFTSSTVGNSFA